MASGILEILRSPSLRDSMARGSRALAEERFDVVRQSEILEQRYDRLLANGTGGGNQN